MVQLAFVQFFSWFALFSMWIYTTPGVTSHIYDMKLDPKTVNSISASLEQKKFQNVNEALKFNDIKKDINDYKIKLEKGNKKVIASVKVIEYLLNDKNTIPLESATKERIKTIQDQYSTGANWVGFCFGIYNLFAAALALVLIFLARITSRKITHATSLIIGSISLISIYFIKDPLLLLTPFIGIGLTWASILAMPYAILTGALPSNKMGIYMGIFNFFIVIPQIFAASVLGFFVKVVFNGQPIYALMLGGFSMCLAAILVLFVTDKK